MDNTWNNITTPIVNAADTAEGDIIDFANDIKNDVNTAITDVEFGLLVLAVGAGFLLFYKGGDMYRGAKYVASEGAKALPYVALL